MMILPRRSFLAGIAAVMAAPAIVRGESLMKLPRQTKIMKLGIHLGDIVHMNGHPIGIVTAVLTGNGAEIDRFNFAILSPAGGEFISKPQPGMTFEPFPHDIITA